MAAETLEAVHLFISGRVQGVGFRYHTQRTAKRLALLGWVRNLPDGRVEVWAEGGPGPIAEFVDWCGKGPASAQISGISVAKRSTISSLTHHEFEIR